MNSDHLHDICLAYQIPNAGRPILVATVFADDKADRPGDISNREADANARLMAAAPDLLAACKSALLKRACDKITRDMLRAAIAKAEPE